MCCYVVCLPSAPPPTAREYDDRGIPGRAQSSTNRLILQAKLRLCPGLDFVDLVVFQRREVLDDKGQGGVDSFSDGVDLASLLRPPDRLRDVTLLPSAAVSVRVGADGAALLEPRGDGSRRVSAIVLIETFTAQLLGTWRRLKLCRNDRCAVSFYDRSRNNSAVYHDSRECGNAIYLRASRARKRQSALNRMQHPIDAEKP